MICARLREWFLLFRFALMLVDVCGWGLAGCVGLCRFGVTSLWVAGGGLLWVYARYVGCDYLLWIDLVCGVLLVKLLVLGLGVSSIGLTFVVLLIYWM